MYLDGRGFAGSLLELEATRILTKDTELGRTTIVDACNGYNKLICLDMLWTLVYRWPSGSTFAYNCYRHWAQLLLCQPGNAPVILLSQEGVTQGDPLSVDLYGITLVSLVEELRYTEPTLLYHFYAADAVFDGPERRSAVQLCLLMDLGPNQGYFSEPSKSLFIAENPEEKDSARREFERAGLDLTYIGLHLS